MSDINYLLREETENIEFKEYWYWSYRDEEKKQLKKMDELLKDIASLLNLKSYESKYLIIGKADKEFKFQDYYLDKENKEIKYFKENDFYKIKKDLIRKLLNNFSIEYLDFDKEANFNGFEEKEIIDILEESINFIEEEIQGKKILLIEFLNIPFLLKVKRDMKSLNNGDIPVRGITNNNEIGIIKLNREMERFYRKKIKELYFQFKYLKSDRTIKNILEIYKKTFYPYHELEIKKSQESFSSSNFFEIIFLKKDDEISEIFIYLSRYSAKAKVINKIFNDYGEILKNKMFYILFQTNVQTNRLSIDPNFENLKKIAKFFSLEDFIKKCIYSPIKEKIQDALTERKSYKKIFINPLVEIFPGEKVDNVISYMTNWLLASKSPILIVEGGGGVGKTTLVKKFMSEVENRDVVFIDSSDLVDSNNLNNVASFLKEYFNKEIDTPLEEELLNLLLDNGDLLVIIDGIDEIILKSDLFNFKDFLNSIFREMNGDLAKTKIILTIRSNIFSEWDEVLEYKKLKLLGFDRQKILDFLKEKKLESKSKKIFSLLEKISSDEKIFSPFIIEMIVSEFEINDKFKEDIEINSNFLCEDISLDKLLFLILDREHLKFELLSVDEQIKIIISVIKRFGIETIDSQLKEIGIDDKKLKFLQQHPLFDLGEGKLYLKYDFLENYFFVIDFLYNLSKCENMKDFEYFNIYLHKVKKIIIDENEINKRSIKYGLDKDIIIILLNEFLKSEDMNNVFYNLLKGNKTEELKNLLDLISIIFYLILLLSKENLKDIKDNTNLLKEIFFTDKNILEKVVLNRKINKKYKFDFSDLTIKNSYINYPYFVESIFNERTFFEKSILEKFCNEKNKEKFSFSKKQFDSDCYISEIIKSRIEKNLDKEIKVEREILKIFKKFYKSGSFKSIKKEKLKGINEKLFDFLLNKGIILEIFETTREKRKDKKYIINDKYQLEFEKLLEKQKRKSYIIDELVKEYIKR